MGVNEMSEIGYIVKDLAPGQGNPRNSEGAFIDLADGRILFVYSRFSGGIGSDNDPANLARIYSSDGGETWSDAESVLMATDDAAQNIMSVSLLRMQNNDIGMFYFVRYGINDGKIYLRRSGDEGQNWSKAACCVPAHGYYVTDNDRVVRLKSGRLILPTGFHRVLLNKSTGIETWDGRAITVYLFSDDDGLTWYESSLCCMNSRHTESGLQEPGVIEQKNGSLYGWARTDMGRQYEMFSHDSGRTWTTPEPSRFTSPCSPMSIKRDPISGNVLAIWNPIPVYQTMEVNSNYSDRNPLVYAISRNDGASWEMPIVLEDDKRSGYCYISIHFIGDYVLLAYCAGGTEDKGCLNRLRIRKMRNRCL